MTPTPGDILAGKYRVERVLGMGGMGVVVAAIHTDLLERRAIKLMRSEAVESPQSVERFLREARAAARLKSEHVAKVHDVGRLESGEPFMVMEYLEGSDLNALVKSKKTLPIEEAVLYLMQTCEALAEAHNAGIVHRDLKPANLFLTQDTAGSPRIKVLDFGISKATGPNTEGALGITRSDALLGSPLFMSPEQMKSPRDADARSDIYSMGAILYKLLTGRAPFVADSILALFLVVMDKAPEPPSSLNKAIPPDLDAVILRCLSKDKAERYGSVAELAAALLPFAKEGARALVDRISRVASATPSSQSLIPSGPGSGGGFDSAFSPLPESRSSSAAMTPPRLGSEAAFEPWRENSTLDQPKGSREDAQEASSPGTWGNTRRGASGGPAKRRRPRALVAVLSAAAGAIVTAVIFAMVMAPSAPLTADSSASVAMFGTAAVIEEAAKLFIAVEPASAPGSATAAATAAGPASATATAPEPATTFGRPAGSNATPQTRGIFTGAPSSKKPDRRSRTTF